MPDPIASLIPQSLVPSGVRDDRQKALAQLFGEMLAALDLSKLSMVDPMTVDARLLPYLIVEFGAQDFVAADLPEHVQRRILKNIWTLKELHGYDAGVKLGLELLGMSVDIVHWYQEIPIGEANTHTIEFALGEQLFEQEGGFFGEREIYAAKNMVSVTKRKSQGTKMVLVKEVEAETFVSPAIAQIEIDATHMVMEMP